MDGEILIEQNEEGALRTDIVGLMYMLKNKKILPDAIVLAILGEDEEGGELIDTFIVKDTLSSGYSLVVFEESDIEPFVLDADFAEAMLSLQSKSSFVMDSFMEDDFSSLYLELDEVMMDCTYFIYEKKESKKKEIRYEIIHYEEALTRISKGETVCVDYESNDSFKTVDSTHHITADMLIEGVWATTLELKNKKDSKKKRS